VKQLNEITLENEPIEIESGIYWVGYSDSYSKLHCNPYLVIEGDEAVLIDGGGRDHFSKVMLKILRTGLKPFQITRLIYSHYDPDICGSLPQFEALINSDSLKIISQHENNIFIHSYSSKIEMLDYRDMDNHFDFATGRRLEFYATPYCHHTGSFVTYDTKTKTLFSSDLFGSFDYEWTLFLNLKDECRNCPVADPCPYGWPVCDIKGLKEFHQKVMTSSLAAAYALDLVESLDIDRIAPQHGSIITTKEDVKTVIRYLKSVKNVGINFFMSGEKE